MANKGFLAQLVHYERFLFGEAASTGIDLNDLGYTIWERTEHLGLNDPLPPLHLCHLPSTPPLIGICAGL